MLALINGTLVRLDGEISPFPLDGAAASAIVAQIQSLATQHGLVHVFATSSWSLDRRSSEFIIVHPDRTTPVFLEDLRAAGLDTTILIQKHSWWPRDRYARMSEAEQVQADLAWLECGGWLDSAQRARLARYGHRRGGE